MDRAALMELIVIAVFITVVLISLETAFTMGMIWVGKRFVFSLVLAWMLQKLGKLRKLIP